MALTGIGHYTVRMIAILLALATISVAAETSPLKIPVRVYAMDAPIAYVFGQISAQTNLRFNFADDVESCRVSIFAAGLTAQQAMSTLIEANSLTYQQLGRSDTYTITGRRGFFCRKARLSVARNFCINRDSLDCEKSSTIEIADQLFQKWGINFAFADSFLDQPISVHIKNGSSEETEDALRNSKIQFKLREGVFLIGLKK
jgi:hypothetical protein